MSLAFPDMETPVSLLGNSSVLAKKLQYPYWETPVSNGEIAVSYLGTGVLTVRCITLLLKDSFLSAHKVLQIYRHPQPSATVSATL